MLMTPVFLHEKESSTLLSGLTAYWSFENNGDDELGDYDLSASGSVNYTTDSKDGTYSLDVNDYLYNNSPDLLVTSNHAVSCWVKLDLSTWSPGSLPGIFGGRSFGVATATNGIYCSYSTTVDQLVYGVYDGIYLKNVEYSGASGWTNDVWHHIVCSYTDDTLYLYVDGILRDSEVIGSGYTISWADSRSKPFRIGESDRDIWPGYIDEFAYWTGRGLTSDEVAELWNSGNGKFYNDF